MTSEEDALDRLDEKALRGLLVALDRELATAENPPPGFEDAIEAMVGVPSPIDEASFEAGLTHVRQAVRAMTSLGEVLHQRRVSLGLDLDSVAEGAGWNPRDLEEFEVDDSALAAVRPAVVARLLQTLGIGRPSRLDALIREFVIDGMLRCDARMLGADEGDPLAFDYSQCSGRSLLLARGLAEEYVCQVHEALLEVDQSRRAGAATQASE